MVSSSNEGSRHLGVQGQVPRHLGRGPQNPQAHSRHPFRQAGGRGDSSISRRDNRKAVRINGRSRQNLRRHCWPDRHLGRWGCLPVKLLLDTHIWLWSTIEPQHLTRRVEKALAGPANELWLSPASVSELLVLLPKGRLTLPNDVAAWATKTMQDLELTEA